MLPGPLRQAMQKIAPHLYYELRDRQRVRRAARRADVHGQMKQSQRDVLVQLARGRVALDVGAHKGLYSFELARVASKLYAIEPNPELANALGSLLALSRYDVRVLNVALSDHEGSAELRVPVKRPGSATLDRDNRHVNRLAQEEAVQTLNVRLSRLDDIDVGAVGVMKVDVEGHQLPLIAGAERTLARHRPDIFIEIDENQRPGSIEAVDARLAALGYGGYFLVGPALWPMRLFRKDVFHATDNAKRGKVRINDFFYFHASELDAAQRRLPGIIFYPVS